MEFATQCLHAGYDPKNGEPGALPIIQSTTFKYDKTADVAALFDLKATGFFYSRLANPTVDAVERKLAALEGGVDAILTSSGQAASFIALMNLCRAGDHIVASSTIYGGVINLLAVTMKRFGIEVTLVDQTLPNSELAQYFRPNTKAFYAESVANPSARVLDFARMAELAHSHGVPLVPIEHGADIVVHSTSKYLDGHALGLGGAIIDSGKFDWAAHKDKFPEFSEPDSSYHGCVYTEAFGAAAYIVKARAQLIRDLGCLQSPQNAFYLNLGLETLPLRMQQYCKNAQAVAEYLSNHPKVAEVFYPGLSSSPDHELAQKYLPRGVSGVLSFTLKCDKASANTPDAGRQLAAQFIDHLKLVALKVHVADIKSIVLHPASTSHRQLTTEQLAASGVSPTLIRLSVGLEDVSDIIADLEQALAQV